MKEGLNDYIRILTSVALAQLEAMEMGWKVIRRTPLGQRSSKFGSDLETWGLF